MKFEALIDSLRALDSSLKQQVKSTANLGLTLRNWLIGAYIVEFEQKGEERAAYGTQLLPRLAEQLAVKGLNRSNLEFCRRLFLEYPQNPQTLSGKFPLLDQLAPPAPEKCGKDLLIGDLSTSQTVSGESSMDGKNQQTAHLSQRPDFAPPVDRLLIALSFSHFVELFRVDDPAQRAFYEIECIRNGWSVRELKRQIGSLLYERMGLSTDKEKLLRLVSEDSIGQQPDDVIKDPYIFEFLGLQPKEVFREQDLETALLDHLQDFLLELGGGFCFEDRQKKIRIGSRDYFIDLVFYHRKLHCHVLIDLKVEAFTHANAGQLNTYLNYYKKHEMQTGDNPPVGLLLCTDKDHALVEYALGGMDENLFVSTYRVALPDAAKLENFLQQKTKEL